MWDFIDKIVYINLDHREDRRTIMKDFFEKGNIPSDKIVRLSAVKRGRGLGCLQSHMNALKMAKDNNWKNVLILEDDLEWLNLEEGYKQLEELVTLPKWDLIQLVGWYAKYDFPRVFNTFNAGAYLVNQHYYDRLLHNRYEALRSMTSYKVIYTRRVNYTADVYWNKLAAVDQWYCLYPCICRQVSGYSDNSSREYDASQVYGIYNHDVYLKIYGGKQNAQ